MKNAENVARHPRLERLPLRRRKDQAPAAEGRADAEELRGAALAAQSCDDWLVTESRGHPETPTSIVSTWQLAEALAAWHMKSMGFADAELTPAGADGGIDVRSEKAVAQVKHYTGSPVGAPAVQQLRGAALESEWVLFYSLSGYTRAAYEYAQAARVALFTYAPSGRVSAQGSLADYLLRSTGTEHLTIDAFALEEAASQLAQTYWDLAWAQVEPIFASLVRRAEEGPDAHRFKQLAEVELDRARALTSQGSVAPFADLIARADDLRSIGARVSHDLNS